MTSVLIDLLLVGVVAFCVWQGFRKGLILSVCGILIIFIAAFLAGKVAESYARPVSEQLVPIMSWIADDAIDEAAKGKGRVNEITDKETIAEIARDAYKSLGISSTEVNKMAEKALSTLETSELTVRESIARTLLFGVAYALLCILGFLIFMLGLTLLMHFLAAIFKLPVLNLVDTIGGTAVGLFYGILILCAVGWGARFLGIVISPEILDKTVILKLFVNHNMLAGMFDLAKI